MNYIAEINAFEQWCETNYLPRASQLLWYKLMSLCNGCGWAEWVTVDNLRLMAAMQIRREASLIEVRDGLIKAGLVEYKKGKKGSPNQYKMKSLVSICTFKNEVNTVVQSEVNTVVQSADINKQDKTKQNTKKTIAKKEEAVVSEKYFENEKLNETFLEFIKMRKSIKSPMTDRAIELMIKKLSKYDLDAQIAMLEQSTINSWKDVYEPKDNTKKVISPNKFHNFEQRDNDLDALMHQIGGEF